MNNKSGTEGTEFDIDWIAVGYNIWLASLLRAMAGYTSILFTAIPIDVRTRGASARATFGDLFHLNGRP